jgi:hypothetical protein
MTSYHLVNLYWLLDSIPLHVAEDFLSGYSCPDNKDIEDFLRFKAIDFAKQGIAQTHLVVGDAHDEPELLGFFSLTNKVLELSASLLSKTDQKRAARFGVRTPRDTYQIPMPLIAQLGKNYSVSLTGAITGDELLSIACDKVFALQRELGGRFVYLECEDVPFLIDFYARNGFRRIETEPVENQLIRMFKYQ